MQLGRRALATLGGGLEPLEWLALALVSIGFLYGEGVRALQGSWVPRMVARAGELRSDSPRLHRVLAPLYAMSLIGAERRRVVRAWLGLALIVAAVLVVRGLPEPWRGIIDAGVCVALLWGLVAIAREAVVRTRLTDSSA
ncbi:MAG TPA: hypothetical protein VMN78_12545 [Longimicrobiales bacterium]|nr:hypothetical protein [Longimicrobiales bacterium]